jgi:cbb3-type cytochrome oxidase subunit 3
MLLSLSLSAAAAAKSLSFTDRLILWLHIAFAIFTIGPVTVAIMSTPRYIRARNLTVVRYLYRTTRIFVLISLGVLVFGIILAQQLNDFAKPWLTISMTLFVVAIVLLVIVLRDQRKSIGALETAEAADALPPGATLAPVTGAAAVPALDASPEAADDAHAAGQPEPTPAAAVAQARHVATVERGRIATLGAVVAVDWLVILVLMVWH